MARKRGNSEGSIYRREVDGRWFGSIVIGFDSKGRRRRKTVSAATRREVAAKLSRLQRDVAGGLRITEQSITLTQLVVRWHEDVLKHQVQESAASNYFSVARNHVLPYLGKKKVADLTPVHVDQLLAGKLREGLSPSTVRRIRSVLAQALDQAMRWGYVNRNVATLARSPKVPRVEGRTLTPEQARSLLDVLQGHRNEALYALMLSTGLRRGEALGLKWTDFDEVEGILRVTRQLQRRETGLVLIDTKTALSRRSVNLAAPMAELLRVRRKEQQMEIEDLYGEGVFSEFIFTSAVGTPVDPRNLLREFKGLCKKAGLGDWHVHELRHSAASLMLAQGVPLQVVSRVLGHASIRMTADVYGHVLDPDRASAAEAIGAVLWNTE
jgi:integrase